MCLFACENMGCSADDTRASEILVCQLFLLQIQILYPELHLAWKADVYKRLTSSLLKVVNISSPILQTNKESSIKVISCEVLR